MTKVCTTCGFIGEPKKVTKGSFILEIVAWLFFLLPGIIYSVWRLTSKHTACPKCGNAAMIPLDTPLGRKLSGGAGTQSAEAQQKAIKKQAVTKEARVPAKPLYKKWWFLLIVGLFLIGFINMMIQFFKGEY